MHRFSTPRELEQADSTTRQQPVVPVVSEERVDQRPFSVMSAEAAMRRPVMALSSFCSQAAGSSATRGSLATISVTGIPMARTFRGRSRCSHLDTRAGSIEIITSSKPSRLSAS
jgi:hypothetical protein